MLKTIMVKITLEMYGVLTCNGTSILTFFNENTLKDL